MKKFGFFFSIIILSITMQCDSRTYEEISAPAPIVIKASFAKDIQPILQSKCIICHAPNLSAGFYPLTNYQQAKDGIDNIIDRITKPNGDTQKMPQNSALPQAEIELFKQWKSDGFLE